MTAAAYAKLLLGRLPASQIQAGPRSRSESLPVVCRPFSSSWRFGLVTKLEASINNIQVRVNVAKDKKVLEWFTQFDYADDHIWRLTSVTQVSSCAAAYLSPR